MTLPGSTRSAAPPATSSIAVPRVVTSGAPSPTLGVPIAMAYLDPEAAHLAHDDDSGRLAVDIRGKNEPARITDLPFYRRQR